MSRNKHRGQAPTAQQVAPEAPVEETVETVAEEVVETPVEETTEAAEAAEPEAPVAAPVFEDEVVEDPAAIVIPEAEEVEVEETTTYETVEVQNDLVSDAPVADSKVLAASEGDQDAAYVAVELEAYAKEMALGRYIDERIGGSWQLKLLRILQKVFNNVSAESFNPCMAVVNAWFYENREGLTSDSAMFRFAPGWSGSVDEYHAFTRFCSLLKLTCDPKSRAQVVKDTNFEYWLEFGLTEAGRDRLLAYFGK